MTHSLLWIYKQKLLHVDDGHYVGFLTHMQLHAFLTEATTFMTVYESLIKSCYEQIYTHRVRPISGLIFGKKKGAKSIHASKFKTQHGRSKKNRQKELEEY